MFPRNIYYIGKVEAPVGLTRNLSAPVAPHRRRLYRETASAPSAEAADEKIRVPGKDSTGNEE